MGFERGKNLEFRIVVDFVDPSGVNFLGMMGNAVFLLIFFKVKV